MQNAYRGLAGVDEGMVWMDRRKSCFVHLGIRKVKEL